MTNDFIEYKCYPRSLGFYSKYKNKIYLNPIVKKYPCLQKYLIAHETCHYHIRNRSGFSVFVLNLLLEWKDFFVLNFNPFLVWEYHKCNSEFNKQSFSSEEIDAFKQEFLPDTLSNQWFVDFAYALLRPDGIISMGIIGYLLLYWFARNIVSPKWGVLLLNIPIVYQKNIFRIKNILRRFRFGIKD